MSLQKAIQVVRIDPTGSKFELDEEKLEMILSQVPKDMKVSIVSIVGAFRTGKSFLLDLFLRYLRYCEITQRTGEESDVVGQEEISFQKEVCTDWVLTGTQGFAQTKLEGNSNNQSAESGSDGFSWRAGRERNTTGIWIYGQPFIRPLPGSKEKIAVFLMDTQGMFDSETTQMLTACIFGLSTLMSSYQIYNVDKRIQEDNLQHLALFTEYGRMALAEGTHIEEDIKDDNALVDTASDSSAMPPPAPTVTQKNMSSLPINGEAVPSDGKTLDMDELIASKQAPFQRLDFLVRDWQNFEDENDEIQMMADMEEYLIEILSKRKQQDLADTREQIYACFEQLGCFLLPHPGFEVTKKNYDGTVAAIRPEFLRLVTRYVDKVFGESLTAKEINGRAMTASELFNYVKVYASLFKEAQIFPEAKTLLEATAEANNGNSKFRAVDKYKSEMEKIAGLECGFVAESELLKYHQVCHNASLQIFDTGANMGRRTEILRFRNICVEEIACEKQRFLALNKEKDPYKNLEVYLIPAIIAVMFLVMRTSQDIVCHETIGIDIPIYDCLQVSDTLSHLFWASITFMVLIAASRGHMIISRSQKLFRLAKDILMADTDAVKPKTD